MLHQEHAAGGCPPRHKPRRKPGHRTGTVGYLFVAHCLASYLTALVIGTLLSAALGTLPWSTVTADQLRWFVLAPLYVPFLLAGVLILCAASGVGFPVWCAAAVWGTYLAGLFGAGRLLMGRSTRKFRAAQDRLLAGQCPECGYDLRATMGRCPECGWRLDLQDPQPDAGPQS